MPLDSTETPREDFGHVKTEVEIGVTWLGPEKRSGAVTATRSWKSQGGVLPWRRRREPGPAGPLTRSILNSEHKSLCSASAAIGAQCIASPRSPSVPSPSPDPTQLSSPPPTEDTSDPRSSLSGRTFPSPLRELSFFFFFFFKFQEELLVLFHFIPEVSLSSAWTKWEKSGGFLPSSAAACRRGPMGESGLSPYRSY